MKPRESRAQSMHICSSCFHRRDVVQETYDTETDSFLSESKPRAEEDFQTRFYCCGRVPPQGPYRKRHGMCDGLDSQSLSSVELAVEAFENTNFGVTKILNPKVPFIEDLPEELYQGRAIEVHGRLLKNASRFSINLSTGKDKDSDLALHFNPRFDRHVIIRNHRIRNRWGVEEITSLQPFPFTIGRNFSVLILVADEQFLIAVNKIHYCAFAFRISVDRIKSMIIMGDISLSLVHHCDSNKYPPQILKKTPYVVIPPHLKSGCGDQKCDIRRKAKSITAGSKIDIFARLKVLPRAFYVNLQKGIAIWPHPIIPFHMNHRLYQPGTHKKEREIVFNSWSNGFWGKEEIISLCPFLPGTPFHLRIVVNSDGYNIYVNDKFLFRYSKKIETDIDSVVIHGDVVVNKVVLH